MTKLATSITFKLSNGSSIPALGLGTVPSEDASEVKDQVKTAIKAGYRHIDTAWRYGTEIYVGEAIKESIEEGIVQRSDLFVTTKIWPVFHKNPQDSFKKSLEDLGLDYVDLLLQHWPLCFKCDNNEGDPPVPMDDDGNTLFDDQTDDGSGFIEFYKRIEELYLENPGKIKSIGVSNYSIPFLKKLLPEVKVIPVVNQFEYHPQLPQQDLINFCNEHKIHVTAYSPVGSKGAPVLRLPLVQKFADKYGVTTNEVANAYHILQGRSSIPRSSNLERIKTTVRLPSLTEEELDQLYQIGVKDPKRHIGGFFGADIGFKY